jgi:hypothetical protein
MNRLTLEQAADGKSGSAGESGQRGERECAVPTAAGGAVGRIPAATGGCAGASGTAVGHPLDFAADSEGDRRQKKMKRAELLMALSERGYFIGQTGAEISTVFGYHLDSQVGRLDEVYIHPLEQALLTGAAVLEDVTKSAQMHMGQALIVPFCRWRRRKRSCSCSARRVSII